MRNFVFFKNMLGQKKQCKFHKIEKKLDMHCFKLRHNLKEDLFSLYKHNIQNKNCFTIGGDHSLSIATLSSSIYKHGNDIKVLWFDAHPDINTRLSSFTSNYHGMPLGFLTKLDNRKFKFQIPRLQFKNILYAVK